MVARRSNGARSSIYLEIRHPAISSGGGCSTFRREQSLTTFLLHGLELFGGLSATDATAPPILALNSIPMCRTSRSRAFLAFCIPVIIHASTALFFLRSVFPVVVGQTRQKQIRVLIGLSVVSRRRRAHPPSHIRFGPPFSLNSLLITLRKVLQT